MALSMPIGLLLQGRERELERRETPRATGRGLAWCWEVGAERRRRTALAVATVRQQLAAEAEAAGGKRGTAAAHRGAAGLAGPGRQQRRRGRLCWISFLPWADNGSCHGTDTAARDGGREEAGREKEQGNAAAQHEDDEGARTKNRKEARRKATRRDRDGEGEGEESRGGGEGDGGDEAAGGGDAGRGDTQIKAGWAPDSQTGRAE